MTYKYEDFIDPSLEKFHTVTITLNRIKYTNKPLPNNQISIRKFKEIKAKIEKQLK